MANCILFGGEKGGVGKSTTAVNIAIMASLMGQDTLFVDTDKQRSTSKFFERRNERGLIPKIPCVHIMGKYLHSEIENLASKYAVVIIDAGGRDSVELRSAMVSSAVSKNSSIVCTGYENCSIAVFSTRKVKEDFRKIRMIGNGSLLMYRRC